MIITCPNCDTRYQVAEKAIGSAGRKVMCAHCQQPWQAVPEKEPEAPKPKLVKDTPPPEKPSAKSDKLFSEEEEAALDAAFKDEEDNVEQVKAPDQAEDQVATDDQAAAEESAGAKPGINSGIKAKRRYAMMRRQLNVAKKLPMARIRANLRLVGILLIAGLIVGGVYFKTEIVRRVPEMAGIYAALGMDVNVTGLEFRDIETLRTLQNGTDVMIISGRIQNITGRQVKVPSVVVSILDETGASLYSWSVAPAFSVIGSGEILDFETQLASAPTSAQTVKLTFADGRAN